MPDEKAMKKSFAEDSRTYTGQENGRMSRQEIWNRPEYEPQEFDLDFSQILKKLVDSRLDL